MYGGRFPGYPYFGSMMGMPISNGLGYGPMRGIAGMAGKTGMRGLSSIAGSASNIGNAGRGLGLLNRLRGGMQAFRGIQWGSLLNNASRALGVVNQTIPLVRQAGPLFNNMRSMIRLASVFKEETESGLINSNINKVEKKEDLSNSSLNSSNIQAKEASYEDLSLDNSYVNRNRTNTSFDDTQPNFFV